MSEADKRQELSGERAAMLAAMGVQVWHARRPEVLREEVTPDSPDSGSQSNNQGRIPLVDRPSIDSATDSASAPTTAAAPVTPVEEVDKLDKMDNVDKVDRVEFTWVKGRSGMVLSNLNPDEAALQLIRDIVVYGDWAREHGEAAMLSKGDFQWPQLLDTGGTPVRALAVFVEKHWSGQTPWIAITAEVQSSVAHWFENIPVKVIELPAVKPSIRDAAMKKTIWQSLKASV
jgi:hypothetical protein